jgi:S-DNA-T family DNA segregation ATPase FtsK/SpoIIIE
MVERIKRIKEEIVGVLSVLGSIYLSMSLFSHYIKDPVLFFRSTEPPEPLHNLGGTLGAYISGWLIILLGIAAFLIHLFIIAFGIKRLLGKEGHRIYLLGGILFILSSSLFLSLLSFTFHIHIEKYPDSIGGLVGKEIAYLANRLLSLPGAYIFSLSAFLSSIILLSPVSLISLALQRRKKEVKREQTVEDIILEERIEEKILEKDLEKKEISPPLPETVRPRKIGDYELPSLELLNIYDSASNRPSKEELLENSTLIERKLMDFDVEGKVTQVHPGPIVTMYEFEPAPGIKINRVVSLSDDLALALKAQSVRVAPLPGKATIGIEVPNVQREVVSLREILSAESFKKSNSKLTLGLGKDIYGKSIIADLYKAVTFITNCICL